MPLNNDKENRPETNSETARKSGIAYIAALSIFFSVLFFFGLGWLLDRWLSTTPWFVVAGVCIGSILGITQFIRMTSKLN
ncbi:MAG: AtpZ/AtpI family protein [Pyrinomonadaceae bacterium]